MADQFHTVDTPPINRRRFVQASAAATATAAAAVSLASRLQAEELAAGGSVNHSVCKWCYGDIPLNDLCLAGKKFGLQSVELLNPDQIPTVRKHDMTCAIMSNPTPKRADGVAVGGITNSWNRVENHEALVKGYEQLIQQSAELGVKNVICFSGNRDGMGDEEGLKNCADGLKKIIPAAEKHGITVSMELLNSKKNGHVDYMCDKTAWGVELCEMVGSERLKLLYDIYHMQIMEGDVIATIRAHHPLISHYHTGGVPGRNEIDDTQELNYPAIVRAIKAIGYTGFIGQEFIPRRADKIASLKQGVEICSV